MKAPKEIMKDYEKAEFYDRVLLFHTYPDMRDEFMDIECSLAEGEINYIAGREKNQSEKELCTKENEQQQELLPMQSDVPRCFCCGQEIKRGLDNSIIFISKRNDSVSPPMLCLIERLIGSLYEDLAVRDL